MSNGGLAAGVSFANEPPRPKLETSRRGGRVVDRTALEMRHTCKCIGGSNPPLSANISFQFSASAKVGITRSKRPRTGRLLRRVMLVVWPRALYCVSAINRSGSEALVKAELSKFLWPPTLTNQQPPSSGRLQTPSSWSNVHHLQ